MNTKHKNMTIQQVAKLAGVSPSTVSRVLNNSAPVNEKTKTKILDIIKEYSYTPNIMARNLKRNTQKNIGFIITDLMQPFFVRLVRAIEQTAYEHGYSLSLCISNYNPEKERTYISELITRQADGLLVIASSVENIDIINLAKTKMEVVSLQANIDNVDQVGTTDEQGTYEVIKHLLGLGHTRIAFLGYRLELTCLKNRLDGYKRAFMEAKIPLQEDMIFSDFPHIDIGYNLAKKVLSLPNPPTAIHCMNEYVLLGVYKALEELHIKVPEDLSVTSFDRQIMQDYLTPIFTTSEQDVDLMGKMATELLIENIKRARQGHISKVDSFIKKNVVIPTKFRLGNSTAPPPGLR